VNDLKHAFNLSDEAVVERWSETPRWQFFSGMAYYEERLPCDATTLVKFRRLLGEEGCEELLAQNINQAVNMKLIPVAALATVVVDSTVQEKAIAHPNDARLLEVARRKLVQAAKEVGVELKQSFAKEGKTLRFKAAQIVAQAARRKSDPNTPESNILKLYAWHAPEVVCMAKGKSRTPYEFGAKVVIAMTLQHNLIVGARAFEGNPYDGHTLREQLEQAGILMQDTEMRPTTAYVDLGYRGVDADNPGIAVKHSCSKKGVAFLLQLYLRLCSGLAQVAALSGNWPRMLQKLVPTAPLTINTRLLRWAVD
jgi:IS5 family transposase